MAIAQQSTLPLKTPQHFTRDSRRNAFYLLAVGSTLLFALSAKAEQEDHQHHQKESNEKHHAHTLHERPDGKAPTGIMGDHMHPKGEVMFSYKYMFMEMHGNRKGSDRSSLADVHREFPVAPTYMGMEMHMLGIMGAPHDRVTVMAMLPYVHKWMDHTVRNGVKFETESKGIGDVQLGTLIGLTDIDKHHFHLNFSLSLPTGSVDQRDNTPAALDVRLPYPMQIGSGTFDLLPGFTYTGHTQDFSWGAQTIGNLRLHENKHDYRLGHELKATVWGARKWLDFMSTSLRLDFAKWGDIAGNDDTQNKAMVPTADPGLRGGERLNAALGINFFIPRGTFKHNRISVEASLPVYQRLEGPQLEENWRITVGWQWSF